MPVRAEAASAAATDQTGTLAGTGVSCDTPSASTPPVTMPTTPPTSVSVAASTRNCHRISRLVAPRALRTPISRVRSVTEIIMIATTPTPPTIKPMLDKTIMARKTIPVTWFQVSSTFSIVTQDKLLDTWNQVTGMVFLAMIVLSDDGEGVLLPRLELAHRAERRDHLVHRGLLRDARRRRHGQAHPTLEEGHVFHE